jgi:hypothetical protein
VIILAMFGVDKAEQRQGIGESLLGDAILRALQATKIIGARALVIHALDSAAAKYRADRGFAQLGEDKETYFLTMKELREALV